MGKIFNSALAWICWLISDWAWRKRVLELERLTCGCRIIVGYMHESLTRFYWSRRLMVNGGPEPAGGRGKKCGGWSMEAYLSARDRQTSSVPSNLLHDLTHNAGRVHRYHGMLYRWHYFQKEKGERRGEERRWNLSRVDDKVEVLSLNKAMLGLAWLGGTALRGRNKRPNRPMQKHQNTHL